jgi:hypothetical protein
MIISTIQSDFCAYQASVSLLVIVLEVLLSCCGYLPRRVQRDMLNKLVDSLCNYSVQRELIRLNVQISVELIHYLAESKKEARKKVKSWTGELLQVRYGMLSLSEENASLYIYPKQIIIFKLNFSLGICT